MRKIILAAMLAVGIASPALAASYSIVSEWFEGGNQFCKYANGTVLNMGAKTCPTMIEGY